MNTRKIITSAIIIILVGVLVVTHIPKQYKGTMTVYATYDGNGESAEVDYDIRYYPNWILPAYVKGTLSANGMTYTDRYTKLKKFPAISDNRLLPSDWWNARKSSVPCNATFVKSDAADIPSALMDRIDILDMEFKDGKISRIAAMFSDLSFRHNDTVPGIPVWGPAQNPEEAEQVAESFGLRIP